jgi:aminopeptidase YwaD
MKIFVISILTVFCSISLPMEAQNVNNIKRIVKELTSEKYHGRCYTNQGADKAAAFIREEFQKAGLQPLTNGWFQPFTFKLNQIREVSLAVDGKKLKPGIEYTVRRNSPSVSGKWNLLYIKEKQWQSPSEMEKLIQKDLSEFFIVVDLDKLHFNYEEYDSSRIVLFDSKAKNFIFLQDQIPKDFVGYGRRPSERIVISMQKESLPQNSKAVEFSIKTDFTKITTKNVIGYLPGSVYADSIIIVCGHYDHLGEIGQETYFPGADDNASAIGGIIELASYIKKHDYPEKSILFIAFSAEEAGLLGSKYFVNNIPIKQSHINFVLNIDMIGFGDEGLQIWNGLKEKHIANKIKKINALYALIDTIMVHKNTPLSDHYPFTEKSISAVFLTTGVEPSIYYHTVQDTYDNTPLSKIGDIIQLISKTINADR